MSLIQDALRKAQKERSQNSDTKNLESVSHEQEMEAQFAEEMKSYRKPGEFFTLKRRIFYGGMALAIVIVVVLVTFVFVPPAIPPGSQQNTALLEVARLKQEAEAKKALAAKNQIAPSSTSDPATQNQNQAQTGASATKNNEERSPIPEATPGGKVGEKMPPTTGSTVGASVGDAPAKNIFSQRRSIDSEGKDLSTHRPPQGHRTLKKKSTPQEFHVDTALARHRNGGLK
ncbi:MAG: hypothetical protein GY765_01255, partial [bacterium]|nr:hypothetical protein [bacterium]